MCDNAATHAHELEAFADVADQTQGYIATSVPVGHGLLLILKEV